MTKEEFNNKLFSTFSIDELALINPKIYHSSKHILYYELYHSGKYKECLAYLENNKNLLK